MPDNIKCSNTNVIGVPKGEERERGTEQLFKKKKKVEKSPCE